MIKCGALCALMTLCAPGCYCQRSPGACGGTPNQHIQYVTYQTQVDLEYQACRARLAKIYHSKWAELHGIDPCRN